MVVHAEEADNYSRVCVSVCVCVIQWHRLQPRLMPAGPGLAFAQRRAHVYVHVPAVQIYTDVSYSGNLRRRSLACEQYMLDMYVF